MGDEQNAAAPTGGPVRKFAPAIHLQTEDIQLELQRFTVLWTEAHPVVAAFISGMVPRHHDAEDLLQRTAATLVTIREKYDPTQPFVAWALGVARIEVLKYRQENRRHRLVFDSETIEAVADAFERVAPSLSEKKAALDECIAKLRGRVREIFQLHYVEQLRPTEIAARLGRSAQSVFIAMHRGRIALRTCMERTLGREGGMS
jgi:RNA polymerase sigma-70 factor (ECF subfamily)